MVFETVLMLGPKMTHGDVGGGGEEAESEGDDEEGNGGIEA